MKGEWGEGKGGLRRHITVNVLLVLLLVPLAGCVSQAQPTTTPAPVAIEPADQPILDAFLRHIETTKSNCTPERMAQYAA